MKYIDSQKPVVACVCGMVGQPTDDDVLTNVCYSHEHFSVTKELHVRCPKCGNFVRVKYIGDGYYTNAKLGK